ncbi:MAG: hypothetical protein ABH836_03600 [Candidatus Omnitrophota bacterium]
MIEVNFLPPEYKKRKFELPDFGELKVLPIIIGIVSFLITLYFILGIITSIKVNDLNKLNNEWQAVSGDKEHVDNLKEEIGQLKKKADIIDEITNSRFLWAKKLNQLSDLMIDGIWLDNLSLGQRKDRAVLILKGKVFSKDKEETALIGDFIKNIRQEKDFFKDFSEIELESIKRRKLGETEVMEFNLILFVSGGKGKIGE